MPQSLHHDFRTDLPDTDYFFLGSGKILAAVQSSKADGATPLGLVLSDPNHFSRKWSSHLFHPEYGLAKTMLTVIIDGVRYQPGGDVRVVWFPDHKPGLMALWNAGDATVLENFWTAFDEPVLVREYTISGEREFNSVEVELSLYANPALYSEFVGNQYGLGARGYEELRVTSKFPGVFKERTLTIPVERTDDMYIGQFYYNIGDDQEPRVVNDLYVTERSYWEMTGIRWTEQHPSPLLHQVEQLFVASAMGLRAAVGMDGQFDASIWQYGYQWSGDASMVAEALVYSGQFEVARGVLENILTRMTIEDGMAMESSRFRGGKDSELNNNGEILKACRTYMQWTDDVTFIEQHYTRISSLANYLLRPEFLNEETGMLQASRDIWERSEATGILPGYDIAHQTFGVLGLAAAGAMAKKLDRLEDSDHWTAAAIRMRESMLNHSTHSMVEEGKFIKRRLLDGSLQTELTMPEVDIDFRKDFVPESMPLSAKGPRSWEPDISECFPICFGVVDPRSDVARNTIAAMEELWSQAWEDGGYGRYNIASEPDSPGAWPLATMYVAAAAMEAGDVKVAQRAIEWLIEKAGAGGSWREFYGERPTPPLPPTGILVWAWAQWITLVVKHILVARVEEGKLVIRPRLGGFSGALRFREGSVEIP